MSVEKKNNQGNKPTERTQYVCQHPRHLCSVCEDGHTGHCQTGVFWDNGDPVPKEELNR